MIDALVKLQDRNCLKDGSSVIHMFERLETGDPYKTFNVPDYDFTATKELGAVDDSLQRYIYILKVLNKIGKEAEKKGVVIAEIKSPYYTSFRGTVKPKLKKDAVMFEMTKENKNKLPENLKKIIEPEIFPVSKVKDCKDKQSSAVRGQTKEKVEKVISEIDRQLKNKKLTRTEKIALQQQKQQGKDMLSGKKKPDEPVNFFLLPKEERKPLDKKKTQKTLKNLSSIYDGSFFESLKSPKKADDLTPIINKRVLIAENNYNEDYNNLIKWFKRSRKKKFIYPLELTSLFPKKFNDENFEVVKGKVNAFMEIYSIIGQDIIDNNDLDLKINKSWDKAPKKIQKKYADELGRDAKKEGLIKVTTDLA